MNPSGNEILVGTVGAQVLIRVVGRGTHLNSPPFREFALQMLGRGFSQFQLDLGQCAYLDSTFLGVMVGISLRLKQVPGGCFRIVNPSERHLELLRNLGVEPLFEIRPNSTSAATLAELSSLAASEPSLRDRAQTVLEAHETLVTVDERNMPRFKDVIQYLKEDLARLDSAAPPASKPDS